MARLHVVKVGLEGNYPPDDWAPFTTKTAARKAAMRWKELFRERGFTVSGNIDKDGRYIASPPDDRPLKTVIELATMRVPKAHIEQLVSGVSQS